jgi:hypothetical protein
VTGIRQEVAWFSAAMEAKLAESDYHGGWKKCQWRWLISRLHEKTAELEHAAYGVEAVQPLDESGVVKILRTSLFAEAVAVANLAMMVADVLGALKPEAWMRDENSELEAQAAAMRQACRLLVQATAKPELAPTPQPTLYEAAMQACAALRTDAGCAVLARLEQAETRGKFLEAKIAEALDCIDVTPCRAKNRLQEALAEVPNE